MVTIENDMGDILARFDNDAEAERFEKAVDLLEKPLPLARRNPNSDAIQRIIKSVQPSIRNKGIEEIIIRINQAVFGSEKIKLTEKVAAFIDFFFEKRTGDLDPNFFFTLAAFDRSEIRTIFSTLHEVRSDMESSRWTDVSLSKFHDATPVLQTMYVAKHLFPLNLSFDINLDGPSSDYALNMSRVCVSDIVWHGGAAAYAFMTGRQLYQSTPIQIAHINLAIKLLSIPEIVQTLSPEAIGQNLAYSNSRLTRNVVKPKWKEPLDEIFSSTLLSQIGVSPETWEFASAVQKPTGWETVARQRFNFFEGVYSAVIGLSTVLARSGDAFDEIQSRNLGLSKAVDVISKEAFGSERLKAKDIYEIYIARNPEYMEEFGVNNSYVHWMMPLFLDMWRYESRPSSSNPSKVKNTLILIDILSESIDDLANFCAGNPHPILREDQTLVIKSAEFLRDNYRRIALRHILMHTDLKRSWREMLTEVQLSFLEFTHWGFEEDLGMRVSEILPSFFEVLDIAKRLKNRLPDHQGLHEIKGDKVKAYALEKYNPLNLFVGHAQVSNCCIYPGSQGISCGQNAFTTSVSRRSKIDYEVHTSLMLVAYNPAVEQFVGSNWAWVPSYVNVPFPTGDGDEVEEIDSVLAQMIVLDQFELSVWASGSNYGERVDVDASISDFMTLAPRMFEDNPFGYILAGISGYTEEIVKQVYLHTFKDLRFVWGRNLKTGLPLVTNINQDILETLLTHTAVTYDWENNIYSDIELTDFTTDVKPLAYPPKQNLEHAYESPDTPYYACVVCGEELRDPDSVNDWEALALNSDNSMHYDVDDRDKGMKFVHIGCVFECDNCQNTLPQGMLNKEIERATEDYVCNNCVEECVQCGSTFVKGESARGMLVETVNNDDACTVCAVPCDSCEGYMWDEDSITVGTNETHPSEICVLCDEDRPACAECGTKDYSLYTELTDIEGSKYCEDCIKSCESCNNTRPKSEKTCGDCGEDF